MKPEQVLQKHWGYTHFRPLQKEAVEAAVSGQDCLVLMATGGGKSICFQVASLCLEGICLVISPLIALMADQVNQLENRHIKALNLSGQISFRDQEELMDNAAFGPYKFIYISPERLQNEYVLERLKQLKINLIAVDEAHCISEWGHDFRPAYRHIAQLRNYFPKVPIMALTATATARVQEDIISNLALNKPLLYKLSYYRKNLHYLVQETEDKFNFLKSHLRKAHGSAIVYAYSRKETEMLAKQLQHEGFQADFFHGGMLHEDKKRKLTQWLEAPKSIMVATNAFGMGIDKPNVRLVAHLHVPDSLENYYQEAGRAGRDGLDAKAVLLYSQADVDLAKKRFSNHLTDEKTVKRIYKKFCNYFRVAYGERPEEWLPLNLRKFTTRFEENPTQALQVLKLLDNRGVWKINLKSEQKNRLQFLYGSQEIISFIEAHPKSGEVIKTILRSYPGVWENENEIDLHKLSVKSGLNENYVADELKKLHAKNIIHFESQNSDISVLFLEPREDDYTINRIRKFIIQYNRNKAEKLAAVLQYLEASQCKNKILCGYFGEQVSENCGLCSYCQTHADPNPPKHKRVTVRQQIEALLQTEVLTSKEIQQKTGTDENLLLSVLRQMMIEKVVHLNVKNQFVLRKKK